MSEPIGDVVIQALVGELARARGRLSGAEKRLNYAISQTATEEALVVQYSDEVVSLEAAIVHHGGEVPPEPEETT